MVATTPNQLLGEEGAAAVLKVCNAHGGLAISSESITGRTSFSKQIIAVKLIHFVYMHNANRLEESLSE
jgi:hypothetical protein